MQMNPLKFNSLKLLLLREQQHVITLVLYYRMSDACRNYFHNPMTTDYVIFHIK